MDDKRVVRRKLEYTCVSCTNYEAEQICNLTDAATIAVVLTRADGKANIYIRESWLRKAPQKKVLCVSWDIAAMLDSPLSSRCQDYIAPDGWRMYTCFIATIVDRVTRNIIATDDAMQVKPSYKVGDKVDITGDDPVYHKEFDGKSGTVIRKSPSIPDSWHVKINGDVLVHCLHQDSLRLAKPAYPYHFTVAKQEDIDWARICRETPEGVDVVLVTSKEDTAIMFRTAWLKKVPQHMLLFTYNWTVETVLDCHSLPHGLPDDWRRVYLINDNEIATLRKQIAAIRAEMSKPTMTITVEAV